MYVEIKDLEIKGCKDVYYPREDSHLLANAVQKHAFGKVLDIGTGSGIQGIVAALNKCDVTFADIDKNALECAKNNAKLNGVSGKFVLSDIFSKIEDKFNTIIFNPPYVASEDKRYLALDGGKDGRDYIDRFLGSYKEHVLEKHVVLLLESSFNKYEKDLKKLNAKVVGKEHYFFEDLVVLLFL
jgi:release factor glutamine methyltransferase